MTKFIYLFIFILSDDDAISGKNSVVADKTKESEGEIFKSAIRLIKQFS